MVSTPTWLWRCAGKRRPCCGLNFATACPCRLRPRAWTTRGIAKLTRTAQVMSATLLGDGTVAADATIVKSSGRAYPVEVFIRRGEHHGSRRSSAEGGRSRTPSSRPPKVYEMHPQRRRPRIPARRAGDPARGSSTARDSTDVNIETLYGAMPAEAQDAVVLGRGRGRRVVVASPIAEAISLSTLDSGRYSSRRFRPRRRPAASRNN